MLPSLLTAEQRAAQRIVCAANRHRTADIIVLGARHFDHLMHAQIKRLDPLGLCLPSAWEQGFVDQFGCFLTRREAWRVAVSANGGPNGQVIRFCGNQFPLDASDPEPFLEQELFSENLY